MIAERKQPRTRHQAEAEETGVDAAAATPQADAKAGRQPSPNGKIRQVQKQPRQPAATGAKQSAAPGPQRRSMNDRERARPETHGCPPSTNADPPPHRGSGGDRNGAGRRRCA
jgi:hypothetical protein